MRLNVSHTETTSHPRLFLHPRLKLEKEKEAEKKQSVTLWVVSASLVEYLEIISNNLNNTTHRTKNLFSMRRGRDD